MARIHVLGGTGYGGSNIVREPVKRGHEVTSFSRSMPAAGIDVLDALQRAPEELDWLAKAVVDEIEEPRHRRTRLHVAY